jgi:hypothetical protein
MFKLISRGLCLTDMYEFGQIQYLFGPGVEVKGLDRNDLIFYCLRQVTVKKWVVDVSKWVWVKIN